MFSPASNKRAKGMKVMYPISFSKEQVNKNKNTTKDFYGHVQAKTPFRAEKSRP